MPACNRIRHRSSTLRALMPRLEVLGWWFHERAPDEWPLPQRLVRRWNANDRSLVLRYLRAGRVLVRYGATSRCRFACGVRDVGRRDLTDGTFVWPDGLAHYVQRHAVRLPPHFVAHVRARGGRIATFALPKPRTGLYDAGPWRRWARACRACVDLRGWRRVTPPHAERLLAALLRVHGAGVRGEVLLERRAGGEVALRARDGSLRVWSSRRRRRPRTLRGWTAWRILPPRRSGTRGTADAAHHRA